jgi:hypothetical protein
MSAQEVVQDELGRLWMTYASGLYCYDGYEVTKYVHDATDSTSISYDYTLALRIDSDKQIWVGTRRRGISILNPETESFHHIFTQNENGPLPIHDTWRFYQDDDGILWILGQPGLVRYDPSTSLYAHFVFEDEEFSEYDIDYYNTFRKIAPDPIDSNRLFIGTRGGLLSFDKAEKTFTHHKMPYNSGLELNLDAPEYLIMDLMFTDESNLWMQTWAGGLMNYNTQTGKWNRYRNPGITPSSDVGRRLMRKSDSELWVASLGNFGVFNLSTKKFSFYNHDPEDDTSIGSNYAFVDFLFTSDSTLIVLGTDGLCISKSYPGYRSDHESFPPYLSRLLINGKELSLDSSIAYVHQLQLEEDENNLTFTINWPVYQDRESVHYQFKLEGFDGHWIDNGNARAIQYTNLKGGNYTLYYRAGREDGMWMYGRTSLGLTVATPIWMSNTFRGLVAVIILFVFYLIYKIRTTQIRREEALKTAFNKRLADREMAVLRAQMNPHFLFNSLNSIKTYILKQRTQEASIYLTKFSQLMRSVLRNSKSDLVTLDAELNALTLYMELESLRFEDEFNYSLDITPDINPVELVVPPLLIQPYVENAIRHGLMEKEEGNRRLEIKITKQDADKISISVKDNGVGFDHNRMRKPSLGGNNKSYGMQITKDRIDLIRKTLGIHAQVKIIDLGNCNNECTGTEVRIVLPLIHPSEVT